MSLGQQIVDCHPILQRRARMTALLVIIAAVVGIVGCGGDDNKPAAKSATASKGTTNKKKPMIEKDRIREMRKRLKQPDLAPPEGMPSRRQPRTFTDLLEQPDEADTAGDAAAEKPLDDTVIAAAGLRKLTGKHLTLITDLAPSPAVDELPKVFDQAVPQWIAYFKLDPAKLAGWNLRAVLMKDKDGSQAKFKAAGLLPDGLPEFLHGFARAKMAWLYDQTSDYYRRHLLLHEGTHAVMYEALGGGGPPWYSEGLAEYLATHRWADGKLTLRYFPKSREETPGLGRIKIIRDCVAAEGVLPLAMVLAYDRRAHRQNEPYAWSWAAVALLDSHPRYHARFGKLLSEVQNDDASFNVTLRSVYDADLAALHEEWQLFAEGLEHGYDFEKTAVDFTPGAQLPAGGRKVVVAADRGWQNSGIRLEAGKSYRLAASGRYQVANEPRVWWCEPGGVSIRYYRGRPLGVLLAAVRPDGDDVAPSDVGQTSALLAPTTIGLAAEMAPVQSGTLFFKINDSAGELGDNQGILTVDVQAKS